MSPVVAVVAGLAGLASISDLVDSPQVQAVAIAGTVEACSRHPGRRNFFVAGFALTGRLGALVWAIMIWSRHNGGVVWAIALCLLVAS
jgi:hypothetical protein